MIQYQPRAPEGTLSRLWSPGHCIRLAVHFISPSLSGRLINSDVAVHRALSAAAMAALTRMHV